MTEPKQVVARGTFLVIEGEGCPNIAFGGECGNFHFSSSIIGQDGRVIIPEDLRGKKLQCLIWEDE